MISSAIHEIIISNSINRYKYRFELCNCGRTKFVGRSNEYVSIAYLEFS